MLLGISADELADELTALYEISRDLICVASSDGKFRRVSAGWKAVLGYSPEELVGRPFLDFVHPDDREKTIAAAREMQERTLQKFKNRYRHKNGSWVTLRWRASKWTGGLTYAVARVDKSAAT
jgi:PAS domain S-box-containing protein